MGICTGRSTFCAWFSRVRRDPARKMFTEAEGINRSSNYILINPQQFSCHTSGRGGCYGYGRIKRRSKVTDRIRCFQIIRCSMWSDVTVHQMFRYMFRCWCNQMFRCCIMKFRYTLRFCIQMFRLT